MKIAILAYDFFIDAIKNLVSKGIDVQALFTFRVDNIYDYNLQIIDLAADLKVPLYFHPPQAEDFENLAQKGTNTFLSLGYAFKAPVSEKWRGLNLHSTLLPTGRGRWPLPWLILKHPEAAGLTLHKHTDDWDAGDILFQSPIRLSPNETLETLSVRLRLRAIPFLEDGILRLDELWDNASPQQNGTYWPMPTEQDRTIIWTDGVDHVLRVVRAFGKFESFAQIGDKQYCVTDAQGWKERHDFSPGTCVMQTGRELLMAASDGFILLRHYTERRKPSWRPTPGVDAQPA
jgi:methionyl-tRNA formyltransferase